MAKSAYIHIPFCAHKCDFCDFAAFAGLDQLSADYCLVVAREIESRLQKEPNEEILDTVFFGGGTPGYLQASLLKPIIAALENYCGLSPQAEITLETTPATITEKKCLEWQEMGINRISIGVESLHDHELLAMGRDHTSAEAIAGTEIARQSGFKNIALDLMYGLPEQTNSSWEASLKNLLSLSPDHLSAYGLTIAQNSPLLRRYPRNSSKYPDETEFAQMYYMLVELSESAGLKQYEIANFSRPGFESRHNLCYWRNQEYLAFGVSAHRYYRGQRSSNFRSLKKYMREFDKDESSETIDSQTRAKEALFLGLRLREGINLQDFHRTYGENLLESKKGKIAELSLSGFLESDNGRLRLSQKGILVSNTVLAELI